MGGQGALYTLGNVIFERGSRFCTRHTGPVAVEFTVFLRATLQPPLSTRAEHTPLSLGPAENDIPRLIASTYANAWQREKERNRKPKRLSVYLCPSLALSAFSFDRRKQTIRRIMDKDRRSTIKFE